MMSRDERLLRDLLESAIPFAEIIAKDRKHRRLGQEGPRAEKWLRSVRYLLEREKVIGYPYRLPDVPGSPWSTGIFRRRFSHESSDQ